MGQTTIEWTATYHADGSVTPGYTFNPWWGCVKVSPGCESCYAETLAKRYGHQVWGPAKTTARRMMSENYWKQPLKWDAAAERTGTRARVFCASMADVFEDHPQLIDPRARLMCLIDETPSLDWLLLTKRPENILDMIDSDLPENVWIGTSVENQEQADKRIPHLLRVPARVRFLSCEPLLGPVNLSAHLWQSDFVMTNGGVAFPTRARREGIHWIIAGGESGPGARPMHPNWARSLRDQCQAAGVAFHFKQWGQFAPANGDARGKWAPYGGMDDPDGKTPIALPDGTLTDLEWNGGPGSHLKGGVQMLRLGKHAAGRLLDGRTWDEVPA